MVNPSDTATCGNVFCKLANRAPLTYPYGKLEMLWSEEELDRENMFLIELQSLMKKYHVQIEEAFDWMWGSDGDEERFSKGFYFSNGTDTLSNGNHISIKINEKINK